MYRSKPEDVRRLDYPDQKMMRPYRYEGFNLGSTIGDQNLFSTLRDLMLFDRALRLGKILSLRSQEEAYAPVRLNNGSEYVEPVVYELYASKCSYGMGWEVCRHPVRGWLVGHAGYNRGISTMVYREVDPARSRRCTTMATPAIFPRSSLRLEHCPRQGAARIIAAALHRPRIWRRAAGRRPDRGPGPVQPPARRSRAG